jgi:hypothetical protein
VLQEPPYSSRAGVFGWLETDIQGGEEHHLKKAGVIIVPPIGPQKIP